jgi:hypothetical protein
MAGCFIKQLNFMEDLGEEQEGSEIKMLLLQKK